MADTSTTEGATKKPAKRRRQLPVAQSNIPPSPSTPSPPPTIPTPTAGVPDGSHGNAGGRRGASDKKLSVEEKLKALSPLILRELKYVESREKLMPGEVSIELARTMQFL